MWSLLEAVVVEMVTLIIKSALAAVLAVTDHQ
jgi:hypothetical protein